MYKKKTVLESTIENYLVNKCAKNGIWCDKYMSGRNGVPDRLLIYNGRHVFIELKRPGEKPRELQIEIHKKMRGYGAEVHVIDSKERIDDLIADILKDCRNR